MTFMKKLIKRALSVILCLVLLSFILLPLSTDTRATGLTQNQINTVARADYMYDATWVCQATVYGWKSKTVFEAGQTYRVPYAWPVTAGKWVGDASYGVTVDQFLIATKDPQSEFYTKQSYYEYNEGSYAPYYGSDCSTFLTFCWGLTSRRTTTTLPNVSTLLGDLTADSVRATLAVGDALNDVGSHVVLVSDMTYDSAGKLLTVEITEQTPPQLKRTVHTPESLVSAYGESYKIYRYEGEVPPPPEAGTNPDLYTVPERELRAGDEGDDVRWLQAVLTKLGYTLEIDGIYGPLTAAQVALFRQDYGLSYSEVADADTVSLILGLWEDKTGYYTTTASSLNMRSGPGTSNPVIKTLSFGTRVAVCGFNEAGTWANITVGATEGWVSMSYLSFERRFTYTLSYNTNVEEGLDPISFYRGRTVTPSAPPVHPEGKVLAGWQLLRASDLLWYDGTSWAEDQADSKLWRADEAIVFDGDMLDLKAGDDVYYLCAVWQDAPEEPAVQKGDIDANGTVNAIDANILKRIITGIWQPNEQEIEAADMNFDGTLNAIDTNYLARHISGLS